MATAVASGSLTILGANGKPKRRISKAALIGCGGRGNGALRDHLAAGKNLGLEIRVVALADVFQDKIDRTAHGLSRQGIDVPKERCFVGFDAYQKVMETDVDMVLMATPPNFRQVHFPAAVEAGKHVFFEKPVAVDPVGARRIIDAGEAAKKKGLSVVAGTQRRHTGSYLGVHKVVSDGAIGRIVAGNVYWCGGRLGFRRRREGWDDIEYLIRNWKSFTELSGDHICEQHVHNLDVANWFLGAHPIACVGMGGRARRQTGDQYDFFSVDYEYPDGVHIHSMCRQINGCWRRVGEYLVGEKGTTDCHRRVNVSPPVEIPRIPTHRAGQVQEHIDLLDSLVKGEPINEARNIAESSLTAVMGRISAYTGQRVTWDQMMKSAFSLKPTPADFEAGNVVAPPDDIAAIPGKA